MLWRQLIERSRPILSHLSTAVGRCRWGGSAIHHFSIGSRPGSTKYYDSDYSDNEYLDDATVAPIATSDDPGARRPVSQHQCGWCGGPNRHQHLYVVVDDWSKGFSIHKIDLAVDVNIQGSHGFEAQQERRQSQHLPPPALRIACSNLVTAGVSVAALGNKIVMSMGAKDDVTIVYDTNSLGQAFVRCSRDELQHNNWNVAVAAGNSLYALVPNVCLSRVTENCWAPDEMYCLQEKISESTESASSMAINNHVGKKWSYSRDPSRLPFHKENSIMSYAVHPSGQTFFVSAGKTYSYEVKEDTYSFDTKSRKWNHHGTWSLPFHGEGHYDSELDAWTGLHGFFDGSLTRYKLGCCDIIPLLGAEEISTTRPSWKLCKEDIISVPVNFSGLDTTLVPMGNGWFCLVECRQRDAIGPCRCLGDGDKFELCVTTFRARYSKNGELLTTDRRLARSYVLSRYAGVHSFPMHAFWM